MTDVTIIHYILSSIENKYIDKIEFTEVSESLIEVTAIVSNEMKIKPVMMMIEANMYTRNNLLAKKITCELDKIIIDTFNNIKYVIHVVTK